MAYEQKNETISIFKNEKHKDKQPMYKGVARYNNEELEVSLWVTESKNGLKYMTGTIKPRWIKAEEAHDDIALKDESNDLPF